MYAHGLFGASARARKACQPKIKEELLNMFPSKHRETNKKKKSLEEQTHFCLHKLRKHTIEMAEE